MVIHTVNHNIARQTIIIRCHNHTLNFRIAKSREEDDCVTQFCPTAVFVTQTQRRRSRARAERTPSACVIKKCASSSPPSPSYSALPTMQPLPPPVDAAGVRALRKRRNVLATSSGRYKRRRGDFERHIQTSIKQGVFWTSREERNRCPSCSG